MKLRSLLGLVGSLSVACALHCGGEVTSDDPNAPDGGGVGPGGGGDGADGGDPGEPDRPTVKKSSRVDVLLAVDNSASMGDKSDLLATSLRPLLETIAQTGDIHLGVVTSSLGTLGGDICQNTGDQSSHAHLSTRGADGSPLAAASKGFLVFGAGGTGDLDTFTADATSLVRGVGQSGCGFEAQLETVYRFLVQPDPWTDVHLNGNNQADLGQDVDVDVLTQRAAFLRPDSLVVVLMLTDEDDSIADPLSVGGQGWAFMNTQFPGSKVFRADGKTTTAPRGTSSCKTNPGAADCTSCGFAQTCDQSDPACQAIRSDAECQKNGGYFGPTEDQLNVRFQRMKERYGIDPQYPIKRYVDAFTRTHVPDRSTEHTGSGAVIGGYVGTPKCTNPLYATTLPSQAGDELCNLPVGTRDQSLVVFGLLGGVPPGLVGASPDWTAILGADPDNFDFTGIDPHMIQSTTPRAGLPGPSDTRGDNGTDPVNGREWTTSNDDLQYACTFALPAPRTCSQTDASCDCFGDRNPPLCGATPGQQLRAKAYPTVRELRVAKGIGAQAVVGSICAADPSGGYASFTQRLAQRVAQGLQ